MKTTTQPTTRTALETAKHKARRISLIASIEQFEKNKLPQMEKELAEYRAGKVTGYNSVIHNRLRKGQKKITFETAAWKQKQIADRELIMEKAKKELAGMKAELEAISK